MTSKPYTSFNLVKTYYAVTTFDLFTFPYKRVFI